MRTTTDRAHGYGGEKISVEVENLILEHPAVCGVAIVAMLDPVFGERACAFVMLNPDTMLTFEERSRFLLTQRITKFKRQGRLEFASEFPVSGAGKILRRTLRGLIETSSRSRDRYE